MTPETADRRKDAMLHDQRQVGRRRLFRGESARQVNGGADMPSDGLLLVAGPIEIMLRYETKLSHRRFRG
jgi:hypothetical protein